VLALYVVWKTFFKPQHLYMFTPWRSCHARSVLRGILVTERKRVARTCKFVCDAQAAWTHLRCKFIDRGYPALEIDAVEKQHELDCAQCIDSVQRRPNTLVVPFKMQFFSDASTFSIGSSVRKYLRILGFTLDDGLCMYHGKQFRFFNCWTSKPNLFRKRYMRFFS